MSLSKTKRSEIIRALLREIYVKNSSPVVAVGQEFGVSRQTLYRYLSELVNNGTVSIAGNGKSRQYLLTKKENIYKFKIEGLQEDIVWSEYVKPLLKDLPTNVLSACSYGFTEILNNAIDHSESTYVTIFLKQNVFVVEFLIVDHGVGIFNKIGRALSLGDPKFAILELAKGKFTTAPDKHTGEGIFFTSRIFDGFYVVSGELTFSSGRNKEDYLFEKLTNTPLKGTVVSMIINRESDVSISDVFDQFSSVDDDSYGFSKTHVPVRLVDIDDGALISRSQAKRLMQRFDRFKEIILDFKDVTEIGQGFADEVFRVFTREHPDINLLPINMSDDVKKMVMRAKSKPNSLS